MPSISGITQSPVKDTSLEALGIETPQSIGGKRSVQDTLQQTTSVENPSFPVYKPSKPTLSPPELRVINSLDRLTGVGKSYLASYSDGIEGSKKKLETIHAEFNKKLKDAAEKTQSAKFWDILKKIGGFILGAVSTVFGISLISTGGSTLIGGLLIASGILQMSAHLFEDTGVWNWIAEKLAKENEEKREKIARLLPAIVGLTAGVLAITSSVGASFLTNLTKGQQIITILNAVGNIAEGTATIGKGLAESKLQFLKGDLEDLRHQITKAKEELGKWFGKIKKIFEQQERASSNAAHIVKSSINTNNRIISG